MKKGGKMTTEKKTKKTSSKIKVEDTSKVELVFTESTKEPCDTCKEPKELQITLPKYTREEMDKAMQIIDKYNLSRQEAEWLVNLNNRVLNDKKLAGCGKCLVQVKKNLKNAYHRLYG
jgi:hypothetical protein